MSSPQTLGVLQLVANLDIGGAQQVIATLSKYLAAAGHRPVVCTFRDGPLRSDIEDLGIPVVVLPSRAGSVLAPHVFVREMRRIRRALVDLVQQHEIDVIQTHLLRSLDFLTATLPRRNGIPVIYWTFHNYNFMLRREHLPGRGLLLKPKRFVYRWLYRLGSRRVAGFIAVSDEVRRSILEEIGDVDDKIVVIPNGVDVERYGTGSDAASVRKALGAGPDDVVMVMVGTFKRQKGHVHLIEAAARLQERRPRLLLVGDGELRKEMEDRATEAGLGDAVQFLGSRRDVPEILAASDCFVLPSLWEGLPIALLEAMATGLPCIATEVSGTMQVVIPGVTGLLVPPGDSDALAKAMDDMLAEPQRARLMGAEGRRRVEVHFSGSTHAEAHLRRFEADLRSRTR